LPGRPKCPTWLNDEAKKVWRTVVPMLERMGILSKSDGNALERYAYLFARWRKEALFIEKHGTTYPVKRDGEVLFKLFPSVKVFDMLTTQLSRMEQNFGLTPSARSRIIAATQAEEKEIEGDDDKIRSFINLG
jgi:P27 family predicted phage terminase small subunit